MTTLFEVCLVSFISDRPTGKRLPLEINEDDVNACVHVVVRYINDEHVMRNTSSNKHNFPLFGLQMSADGVKLDSSI